MPQRGSLHLHAMPPRATACPDGSGASQSAAPQAKASASRQRANARPDDSGAPQPPALNSGAVQPVARKGSVEALVEDLKQFGRIPQRHKDPSEAQRAENSLAKRFARLRDSIPDDVLQELQARETSATTKQIETMDEGVA